MANTRRAPTKKTAPAQPDRHELSREPITARAHANGLERERVAELQRARMLAAMTEVACERGAANVTVAHVVARAGVSRRTFYEIFEDAEDCFLAAVGEAIVRVKLRALAAYEGPGRQAERIRGALAAVLRLFDEEPSVAQLLVVETLAAGRKALALRARTLAPAIDAVDRLREEPASRAEPPSLAGEGAIGAVLAILHARLLESRRVALSELVNPLMSTIVLPYLGPAAARRELERPTLTGVPRARRTEGNPLKGFHMRLTYRTVCVLSAVAGSPGSSNRAIGAAAGISDQGQISKLLSRLEKLGLVKNAGPGSMRGEPNVWTLTRAGEEVHESLAHST